MQALHVVLLSAAVSLDAVAAGAIYSQKSIRVSILALALTGLVAVADTTLGMAAARMAGKVVAPRVAIWIGAMVLVLLGFYRFLAEYLAGTPVSRMAAKKRRLIVSIGRLVITVMTKPEAADLDKSSDIGPGEALLLGLALSVDNVVAVSALNLNGQVPAYTPVLMGLAQTALFAAGCYGLAWLTSDRLRAFLPYAAAATLMVLGLVRLL